jgi:hypothetical protein
LKKSNSHASRLSRKSLFLGLFYHFIECSHSISPLFSILAGITDSEWAMARPPLQHNDLIIRGLDHESAIISGELNRSGNITWDSNPDAEFKIDLSDPRYQACLETARQLKAQYPIAHLDPVKDRAEIVDREAMIVRTLADKWYEQFGGYNPEVSKALTENKDSINIASLHKDWERRETPDLATLSEFQKNELICRHQAPGMSALCEEAGMPNFYVIGFTNSYYYGMKVGGWPPRQAFGMSSNPLNQKPTMHAYAVSRTTGNIIEGTCSGDGAYRRNIGGASVDDFLAGKTIVTASGETYFTTYGTGDTGTHAMIIDNRCEKLACGELQELPSYLREDISKPAYAGQMNQFDQKITEAARLAYLVPLRKKFEQAVEEGNVATARQCVRQFPFDRSTFSGALETAAKAGNHPPMVEFLIDHFQGNRLEFFTKALSDPQYTKLGVAYFAKAEPKTWPMKLQLVQAEAQLRAGGHHEASCLVKNCIEQDYKGVTVAPFIGQLRDVTERATSSLGQWIKNLGQLPEPGKSVSASPYAPPAAITVDAAALAGAQAVIASMGGVDQETTPALPVKPAGKDRQLGG